MSAAQSSCHVCCKDWACMCAEWCLQRRPEECAIAACTGTKASACAGHWRGGEQQRRAGRARAVCDAGP